MGAAAVGAVVKEAVRCRLTAVAVKLPPVIAISVASFALPWKVPATLTVPEVSRNALLAAPKVEVPLADNDSAVHQETLPTQSCAGDRAARGDCQRAGITGGR